MATARVVGLFNDRQQVEEVIDGLTKVGIERNEISLTMRDREELQQMQGSSGTKVPQGIGAGAVTGTVAGGLAGLLMGAVLVAIPGVGPILAIGPLSAALATGGAVAGATAGSLMVAANSTAGLIGALEGLGIPEEEAQAYTEGIRGGRILLMANTEGENQQGTAWSIMQAHGAMNLNEYHHGVWSNHDPKAPSSATPSADSLER